MRKKLTFFSLLWEFVAILIAGILIVAWGCPFYRFIGIPCPGCGMTRAWIAFFHGQFQLAFSSHPLFWTIPLLVILFWLSEKHAARWQKICLIGCGVIFLLVYLIRMLLLFPHTPPMTWNTQSWLYMWFFENHG